MISYAAKLWCSNRHITLRVRPKNAHADMIERHHQVLRTAVRKLVAQATIEGIPRDMDEMVEQAVIAKNTIITVKKGVTLLNRQSSE